MKTSLRVLGSLTLLAISALVMCLMWGKVADWIIAEVFLLFALASYIVLFGALERKKLCLFFTGSNAESKNKERRREMGIVETAKKLLEQAKEMNRHPMWTLHRKDFEEYLALGNLHLQQGNANDAIADLRLALVFGEMGRKPLEPLS